MSGNGGAVVDRMSGFAVAIGAAHHEIHEGCHFTLADFTTLAAAAVIDFAVQVPDSLTWPHMVFTVQSGEGPVQLDMYEGTIADADGTLVTPINNNRNSSEVSTLVIRVNPTVTAVGTRLSGAYVGAGGNAVAASGGMVSREQEYILKQNTKYLFRLTNQHTAQQIISYTADWYEMADRRG